MGELGDRAKLLRLVTQKILDVPRGQEIPWPLVMVGDQMSRDGRGDWSPQEAEKFLREQGLM